MSGRRLYYPPSHTEEVLKEITSGASTIDELADQLGYIPETASNKVQDGVTLELIERENSQLSISDDARRVVQLKDTSPLEAAFCDLPGVSEILERIEDESLDVEEIGRMISFETGSNAAAEETFRNYGRVYGEWIEYLGLGVYTDGMVAGSIDNITQNHGPLENPRGANNPQVRPEKVFDILPLISKVDSREELKDRSQYSEAETAKVLSTCYGLGIAESTRREPQLTSRGKNLQQASLGNRKRILREALLEVPLVQAYCERIPDGEFRNQDVMNKVSEDHLKGWNETTVQTRAKRLYSWLLFTELAEEQSRGYLKPSKALQEHESVAQ